MTKRDAVLEGIAAATMLHEQLSLISQPPFKPIDVFGVIAEMNVPLVFRPLDRLLGFFLPETEGGPGIMVTTTRRLHMQRYTAAHELGHFVLDHRAASLDENIGLAASVRPDNSALQEIAADAFAAEFMLPRWLIVQAARTQGWQREHLTEASKVYQLSLRLGMSYEATSIALRDHDILSRAEFESLLPSQPKLSKMAALGDYKPDSYRRDVWEFSEADSGSIVLGGPTDILIFNLREPASSGYRWDISTMTDRGFNVISDSNIDQYSRNLSSGIRKIVFEANGESGGVSLKQVRSREHGSTLVADLLLSLDLDGKRTLPIVPIDSAA